MFFEVRMKHRQWISLQLKWNGTIWDIRDFWHSCAGHELDGRRDWEHCLFSESADATDLLLNLYVKSIMSNANTQICCIRHVGYKMVLEVQCFSTQSCVSQGRKPRWTKSNSTNATRSINAITRVVYSVEGLLTINCIAPEKKWRIWWWHAIILWCIGCSVSSRLEYPQSWETSRGTHLADSEAMCGIGSTVTRNDNRKSDLY